MRETITKLAIAIAIIFAAVSCCNCKSKSRTAQPLIGTEWHLTRLMGVDMPIETGRFHVTFTPEGEVTGMGACNILMGNYKLLDNRKIEMGHIASTRRFCPDMERETEFLEVLQTTTSYEIDGDLLLLFHNGEMRAVLQAQPTSEKDE